MDKIQRISRFGNRWSESGVDYLAERWAENLTIPIAVFSEAWQQPRQGDGTDSRLKPQMTSPYDARDATPTRIPPKVLYGQMNDGDCQEVDIQLS